MPITPISRKKYIDDHRGRFTPERLYYLTTTLNQSRASRAFAEEHFNDYCEDRKEGATPEAT